MLRQLPCFALLAVTAACNVTSAPEGLTATSSTIVVRDDRVWLTSPDDDAVVELDATTLEELSRISVEGSPEQLAFVGDTLVVTLGQHRDIAWIDVVRGSVRRVATRCGGTRAVVAHADGYALVSCPYDDVLFAMGPEDLEPRWTITSPGSPTALAIGADRFAVTESRTGALSIYALSDRSLIERIELSPEPGFAAIQVDAFAIEETGISAAFQLVDHDSDRARPPGQGGYGAVVDGVPRIEPHLHSSCGPRYARFDGGARVFSGPSAMASAGGYTWIAHRYTGDVAVLGCGSTGEIRPRVATFTVGHGPRGIVTSHDGRVAWVDVGFDHALARLELPPDASGPEGPVITATNERTRRLDAARLSELALRGRTLFFDADETHLTPAGVVTCGTCHPAGGDDGLTWFFHTAGVAPKLRRTPPAWGARPELAPFHWDGELSESTELIVGTVREIMEGDGLLVDLEAMAAYMAEAPIPLGRPARDAADVRAIATGRALFESSALGCIDCHSGALFSGPEMHRVLEPADDPIARMTAVSTPSLRAIRARSPFLHDGRAPTLRSVFADQNPSDRHGRTSHLHDAELDALVAYLETL